MIVSELSKHTGVRAHVVRYYVKIGILKPKRHPINGYKLFSTEDVHRICFIRRAQCLGFKLSEIEKLLLQASNGASICEDVRAILKRRIKQTAADLEKLKDQLRHMENELSQWERIPNGNPDQRVFCPLIERPS